MSKQIKQLEMDALKQTFQGVEDCVLLSSSGVDAHADHQIRMTLRKKNIRLQVVKNSLARRVFDEIGVKLADIWTSPTAIAWGGGSLAELSRELSALIKKNDKIKVKVAVSERQAIPFQKAIDMPTKPEAIGRVIALAMSPAQRVLSQILAPGGRIAGQIKTLGERASEPAAADTPAAPAAS